MCIRDRPSSTLVAPGSAVPLQGLNRQDVYKRQPLQSINSQTVCRYVRCAVTASACLSQLGALMTEMPTRRKDAWQTEAESQS